MVTSTECFTLHLLRYATLRLGIIDAARKRVKETRISSRISRNAPKVARASRSRARRGADRLFRRLPRRASLLGRADRRRGSVRRRRARDGRGRLARADDRLPAVPLPALAGSGLQRVRPEPLRRLLPPGAARPRHGRAL